MSGRYVDGRIQLSCTLGSAPAGWEAKTQAKPGQKLRKYARSVICKQPTLCADIFFGGPSFDGWGGLNNGWSSCFLRDFPEPSLLYSFLLKVPNKERLRHGSRIRPDLGWCDRCPCVAIKLLHHGKKIQNLQNSKKTPFHQS